LYRWESELSPGESGTKVGVSVLLSSHIPVAAWVEGQLVTAKVEALSD
jgi:hypothetical protein